MKIEQIKGMLDVIAKAQDHRPPSRRATAAFTVRISDEDVRVSEGCLPSDVVKALVNAGFDVFADQTGATVRAPRTGEEE